MSRQQLIQALWGEHRGKLLCILLLLLLLAFLQFWQQVLIEPELETLRGALLDSQKELRLAQQRVAEGGGARLNSIADDLDHFYQIVPARSGLGSFIGRLYGYAGDSGIDIDSISYTAKPVEGVGLLGYQLHFSVSGRYEQIKKFIYRLETSPSVLIVGKIGLSGKNEKVSQVVALQMELQTYFREEER